MLYKDLVASLNGECPFCNPTKEAVVYDDGFIVIQVNIAPYAKLHLLVYAKEHSEHCPLECFSVANDIVRALHSQGMSSSILYRTGENSGKSIYHAHVHVVGEQLSTHLGFELGGNRKVLDGDEILKKAQYMKTLFNL